MLLILLSWSYILFTVVNLGYVTKRGFRIRDAEFHVTTFLGLSSVTLLAGLWAFFGRLHWEFHAVLLAVNLLLMAFRRKQIIDEYAKLVHNLGSLPATFKLLLSAVIILILAKSASAPFILDNESYYLQTIKWLNEHGYVKGIANLHIFLGQQSGWHLAQSAFSFSFLYDRFNDLSGFSLMLGNLFAFYRIKDFMTTASHNALIFAFLPAANLLLLQFVSAPSPDLPIYILTFIIADSFLKAFKHRAADGFIITALLALFAVFIKPTAVVLLFFPAVLLLQDLRLLWKQAFRVGIAAIVVLIIFLLKNYITSGHPLFPIRWSPGATFAVPDEVIDFYYSITKLFGYRISASEFEAMSVTDLFHTWLQLPKMHGIFNWLILLIILLTPFLLYKLKRRGWWVVYLIMLTQMILLALSSPQYRFFLNFVLLFGCMFCSLLITKRFLPTFLVITTSIAAAVTFTSVDLRGFTNNPANAFTSKLSFRNIVIPHANSKASVSFERIDDSGFEYFSPVDHYFFWGTGDGPLPSVNKKQIKYFRKRFQVVPQQLGDDIGDGFYARQLSPIE